MQNNDQRSNLSNKLVIVLAASVAIFILVYSDFGKNQKVVYDCREAHWHPDYPIKVREECKRLIREELEKMKKEELEKKFIRV
jgi:hypothetical protein